MAHQPVGDSQTITTSATSAMVQFAVQSDTVRVVPTGQNVHVAIGTTAVATTSDYFVPAGTPATLNLGRASSMGIADIAQSVQSDHSRLVDLRSDSGEDQRKGGVDQTQQSDGGSKRNQRTDH